MSIGTISQAIEVSALYYYPIKSCRGIGLEQACLAPRGIVMERGRIVHDGAAAGLLRDRARLDRWLGAAAATA